VLAEHAAEPGEAELRRFGRIEQALRGDMARVDLLEGTRIILAYEAAYRIAQLSLERLVWLAKTRPALTLATATGDDVIGMTRQRLPNAVGKLEGVLNRASDARICADTSKLEDVRRFLADATIAAQASTESLIDVVLKRHGEVQHGKFDHGRRKMSWIERIDGRIALTSTQVGGLQFEATVPSDITPHFYRSVSADALRRAAGL
jgi:hypothetical protein